MLRDMITFISWNMKSMEVVMMKNCPPMPRMDLIRRGRMADMDGA